MRPIIFVTTLIFLGGAAGPLSAQVDCEAARCAAQAEINRQCPCTAATNHGRYVSCVTHVVKTLAANPDLVPPNCKGKVTRCAARSTCGKSGFVRCLFPTDTCDLATGTCTENPALACTTDLECGSRCSTKRSSDTCSAQGGTDGGAGS